MQEIRSRFVEIFSHISSTQRQLQNHLFLISSSKWHVLRKWPFSPSLSKIKFCQTTLLFLSQKNKFPVKICLSLPPKKTTRSGYNANHPCGNKSRPQVLSRKVLVLWSWDLFLRRDDEDHIAEMEKYGKRPTEKWEVSEYMGHSGEYGNGAKLVEKMSKSVMQLISIHFWNWF